MLRGTQLDRAFYPALRHRLRETATRRWQAAVNRSAGEDRGPAEAAAEATGRTGVAVTYPPSRFEPAFSSHAKHLPKIFVTIKRVLNLSILYCH